MSKAKTEIPVIYEDGDIIVINKPSGVSVTKDRANEPELLDMLGSRKDTLRRCSGQALRQAPYFALKTGFAGQAGQALRRGSGQAAFLLIHRLDKPTSGVMILAKNTKAQSRFSAYFENRQVKKTYLTLVTGVIPGQGGTIDAPIGHSRKHSETMCIDYNKGKESVTTWQLLADFGTVALLSVSPLSGRTHQIRVHLPSIGLPLLIDPLYGSSRPVLLSDYKGNYKLSKNQVEKPLIERLTLHAYQIEIPATEPNTPTCFIAGLDKKFTAAIKMLTKHNPKGPDSFVHPDDLSRILNAQRLP